MCISMKKLFIYFVLQVRTVEIKQFPGVFISLMMIPGISDSEPKYLQYF